MNTEKALSGFFLITGLILYVAGVFWLSTTTLLWLWQWFVTPLGVLPLTFWHAAGLASLAHFLVGAKSYKTMQIEREDRVKAMLYPVTYTLAALGIGYGVHLLM